MGNRRRLLMRRSPGEIMFDWFVRLMLGLIAVSTIWMLVWGWTT